MKRSRNEVGPLGGLVHSAGIGGPAPITMIEDDTWDEVLDVNLRAAATLVRALHDCLLEANPGSAVVYISSIEALVGSPFLPAYCASKAGLLGLTRAACAQLGSEGIRINSVCPGAVDTPLLAPLLAMPGAQERLDQDPAGPAGPARGRGGRRALLAVRRGGLCDGHQCRGRRRPHRGGGGLMAHGTPDPDRWWQSGVFYQIYPRSYADSNGDGIGDLPGIISKLDHLARLGITGIWLSPVTCSPNRDWGYDVSNYRDIDPSFGTLDDLDPLVREGAARGIRILMDLVPNHTSNQHAWFVDAQSGRDSAHRDYYVWADPKPDGSPPNNWVSIFGGPAWELDEASGQFYLHNFEAQQPDLNWWSDDVRREFDDIVRFWWDRGVAGFRIDVCNMMIKDKELRDNPPATEDDPIEQQFMGVRYVYNSDRPEAHDILRHWRTIADTYEPRRLLIGETNVETLERLSLFYGGGHDELHGGFNFQFMHAPLEAAKMREVVEGTEALLPEGSWPTWHGSNHDFSRLTTRWAGGDPAKVKVALLILLTLRGTPFLYAGDEIGLPDADVPKERLLDPVGVRFYPYAGRDGERTPMVWDGGPNGGFSEPGVRRGCP